MKACPKCKNNKELAKFYKNKTARDGVTVYCKDCWNSITNARRKVRGSKAAKKQVELTKK